MGYTCIVLAIVGIAGNFTFQKIYQKKFCFDTQSLISLPFVLSVFNFLFYFFLNQFTLHFCTFSFLMALLYALLCGYNTIVGLIIMRYCSLSFFSMFIMMGGMFLPFLYGIIFLDENASPIKLIAIVIMLFSLFLISISNSKHKISAKGLWLCITVFISNGFVSIVSKIHQINKDACSTIDFMILTTIITFLITGAIILVLYILRKRSNSSYLSKPINNFEKKKINKSYLLQFLLIMIISVVSCTGTYFNLYGAKIVDASMLYPMTTGGSIIMITLFEKFLFNVKLNKQTVIGVIAASVSTMMFALK